MSTTRRWWVPLLAAGLVTLLLAVFVGPPGAGDEAKAVVEPRATTRTITIPGGAFIPTNDDLGWQNDGYQVVVVGPSTSGSFTAPLFFEAPEVTIKRMTLFAYDNGGGAVCVGLYRTKPGIGDDQEMGEVCSTGDTNGVRSFTARAADLSYLRLTGLHGPYLGLYVPGTYSNGYSFYGVRITYSY